MSSFTGLITNDGASFEVSIVVPVNTTQIQSIDNSALTVYLKKIEYSNSTAFTSNVTPTNGVVNVYFSVNGVTFSKFRGGENIQATTSPVFTPYCSGDIDSVKIITSNITGAMYARLTFSCFFSYDPQIDSRVYTGLQAFTTQSFSEANSKNGTQYEASDKVANLGVGANRDTILITGNFPIIIKSRQIVFNGTSIVARVFKNPTYSGGVVVPYYNLSDLNPVTGTVVVKGAPTVTSTGTEFAAPTYGIGSTGQGNSEISTYTATGNERILAPNSTYLLRLTNDSAAIQDVAVYISWYEGILSSNT